MEPRWGLPVDPIPLLQKNLAAVQARIRGAQGRGSHAAPDVRLVAVTKSISPSLFPALAAVGVLDVGENRVQAAEDRRPLSPPGWRWHGIGHLQRNKVGRAVALFDVFHALDSLPLARRIDGVLAGTSRRWPVYIQVNAAADPDKGGFAPEETPTAVTEILRLPHLEPLGFMTMARIDAGEAGTRETFRTLREVRDEVVRRGGSGAPVAGLSMGMSDDFEWAVEEGATVVRVGRALFEGLQADRGAEQPPKGETEGDAATSRAPEEGRA